MSRCIGSGTTQRSERRVHVRRAPRRRCTAFFAGTSQATPQVSAAAALLIAAAGGNHALSPARIAQILEIRRITSTTRTRVMAGSTSTARSLRSTATPRQWTEPQKTSPTRNSSRSRTTTPAARRPTSSTSTIPRRAGRRERQLPHRRRAVSATSITSASGTTPTATASSTRAISSASRRSPARRAGVHDRYLHLTMHACGRPAFRYRSQNERPLRMLIFFMREFSVHLYRLSEIVHCIKPILLLLSVGPRKRTDKYKKNYQAFSVKGGSGVS